MPNGFNCLKRLLFAAYWAIPQLSVDFLVAEIFASPNETHLSSVSFWCSVIEVFNLICKTGTNEAVSVLGAAWKFLKFLHFLKFNFLIGN